jgi:hypothetical protein
LISTIQWLTLLTLTAIISITYIPVTSRWVIALHNLSLYLDLPPPCHLPSDWFKLFSNQTFSHINTPTISTLVILHTYPPMKMEQTECSETLAYKIQMLGYHPEESIQQVILTSLQGVALENQSVNTRYSRNIQS